MSFMRKIFLLLFYAGTFLFYAMPAMAQERVITGTVLSDQGNAPIRDVTVTVRGTKTATKTDENGRFSIRAAAGQTLVFTFVDYTRKEVSVGSNDNIAVSLAQATQQLEEVVVTAMDIRRNPKELGYSIAKVDGDELKETQRENFMTALQGRVAGLTVNTSSGLAGASSQIVLRGFNSLSLDNSPLFVIDGIIVDNSTMNETSDGGVALGLGSNRANNGNDYSNRISDINPNDIETITVLKGPEATALYGSQASSGAIIITTKKAKATGKLGVIYDNAFRLSKLTRYPETINAFMGGANGVASNTFTSFGPAYPDSVKLFDNKKNFFRNGFSQTHNLTLEYGKKNASFRVSGSLLNQQSPVPRNEYKRYNLRVSNSTKIGKYLELNPAIAYVNTVNNKPLRGLNSYLLSLLIWPDNDDIRDFQDGNGRKKQLFSSNPNADFDNPFWSVNNVRSSDKTNRFTYTLGVNLTPLKWLSLAGRFGYDTYKTDGYTRFDSSSFYLARAMRGSQDNYYREYKGYNHTITSTARHTIKDFSGRIMVGNMWQDYETSQYAVSGNNLKSMSSSDSNNTDPATRIRLTNAKNGKPNYSISRQAAYFGEASIGWKSAVFLTYSHRFEESSVFPKEFRSYNYPAASLSVVMTDLIPGLKTKQFNFWKLRSSLASTARSSSPYANQSTFADNTGSGGGFVYGINNLNPLLEPERQKTFEVGTELRLFNQRFTLDATYYKTKNTSLIAEKFRSSYGTGFILNTLNVGSNQNTGVEISLDLGLFKTTNFKWNTRFNFNRMRNKVLSLPANVPEFYIADTWLYSNARGGLVVGGSTTTITAFGYQRNRNGEVLIVPSTGLPAIDQNFRVRGDRNADFTIGWLNTMSYKKVRLSFLWDLKVGGDIFNGTDDYLTNQGNSLRTADRLTPRVIKGVLADGLENSDNPTRNTIEVIPYYDQRYYNNMQEEEFIEKDVNWFRLRDLSLSYSFGSNVIKRLRYATSLSAFVTVNDLILFTNYTGADPQVSGTSAGSRGIGAFGFDYGNVGAPISVNAGFKVAF